MRAQPLPCRLHAARPSGRPSPRPSPNPTPPAPHLQTSCWLTCSTTLPSCAPTWRATRAARSLACWCGRCWRGPTRGCRSRCASLSLRFVLGGLWCTAGAGDAAGVLTRGFHRHHNHPATIFLLPGARDSQGAAGPRHHGHQRGRVAGRGCFQHWFCRQPGRMEHACASVPVHQVFNGGHFTPHSSAPLQRRTSLWRCFTIATSARCWRRWWRRATRPRPRCRAAMPRRRRPARPPTPVRARARCGHRVRERKLRSGASLLHQAAAALWTPYPCLPRPLARPPHCSRPGGRLLLLLRGLP